MSKDIHPERNTEAMTKTATLYSLNEAARLLDEDRNLITFLARDRQIPMKLVGRTKVIDTRGLDLLKRAVNDYRAKPEVSPA